MAVKVAILSHLPQELPELFADLTVALRQSVTVHDGDLAHVGQGGELVEIPTLGFQLGQHLIQTVYPDDLLAKTAETQVVGDGQAQLLRLGSDAVFGFRCHTQGDEFCFLFSLH